MTLLQRNILLLISLLSCMPTVSAKGFIDHLPAISQKPVQFSISNLKNDMDKLPLHHIEGIWQLTTDGAEIAIIRSSDNKTTGYPRTEVTGYSIILLHSQNRALRPGTLMGLISPSARKGTYEARIYTRSTGSRLHSPKKFKLILDNEESRLVFEIKKSAFSVNLWRLLPYMWRYSVTRNNQSGTPSGCIRIYPEPELPVEPRYL